MKWHTYVICMNIGESDRLYFDNIKVIIFNNFYDFWKFLFFKKRFTLRKFGEMSSRWYNLDSLLRGPQSISQTYLGMLLKQLEEEGMNDIVIDEKNFFSKNN